MRLIHLAYTLMICGILLLVLGFVAKDEINTLKLQFMPSDCHEGNDVSTCPVLKNNVDWYIGFIWFIGLVVIAIGTYLRSYSKNDKTAIIEKKIDNLQKKKDREEKFEILLKGLNESEKKIMEVVFNQDGIGQNTICIRTELSKAKLSTLLSDLEKKNLIRKVREGKINRIYLKQGI